MISTKKLVRLARKWQKFVVIRRKRVTFPTTNGVLDAESCSTTSRSKGHFVVYTNDQRRFVLPLKFLNHDVVRELFVLAEEEFGLPSDGPLTLPCDASFLEYVISLIQHHMSKDVQNALAMSISSRCSSSLYLQQEIINQQERDVQLLKLIYFSFVNLPGCSDMQMRNSNDFLHLWLFFWCKNLLSSSSESSSQTCSAT